MTKIFLPALAGCLMLATAAAQSPESEEQMPPDKAAVAPQPADDRRKSSPPAPVFTPSEKIGADSAVSFPVDI
jgi:hypothetical protein